MLNSMRSKGNQTMVWILMGLLIVGLTGFGIGNFTGGSRQSVATVGETDVGVEDYGRQLNRTVQNISNQIGRNLTPAEITQSGIQQSVLSEMIAAAALDNEATRLGISVGDAIVRDELLSTGVIEYFIWVFKGPFHYAAFLSGGKITTLFSTGIWTTLLVLLGTTYTVRFSLSKYTVLFLF